MKPVSIVLSTLFAVLIPLWASAEINDAQIASIVVTANQVDIDAGQMAVARASNAEIRMFGEMMTKDHAGVNQAAVELVTRLGVTPEDNPTSRSLAAGGKANIEHLQGLRGTAFDQAYIHHEVVYHQQVIDAVDNVLIPGAQNPELKALLVKVRPAFIAHLQRAQQLEEDLASE